MTAREWKAGDVALVDGQVAYCGEADGYKGRPLTFTWTDKDGSPCSVYVVSEPEARPLLVIDPEDRDQVDRLSDLYDGLSADAMQAALRAMLEPPAPPRPAEPIDIGSWVTDGEGSRWVLMPPAYGARRWCRWQMSRPGTDSSNRSWTDLALPVTVGEPEPAFPPDLIESDRDIWRWCPECTGYRAGEKHFDHGRGFRRSDIESRVGIPLREVPHGAAVTS